LGVTQLAKLVAIDGAPDDYMGNGNAVSISDDTLVIGAFGDDDKGTKSGSALVYSRDVAGSASSTWQEGCSEQALDRR